MTSRRQFLVGGCLVTLPVVGVAQHATEEEVHPETGLSYKDMYWQAQSHINDLEQEVSELRTHARIMRFHRENTGSRSVE